MSATQCDETPRTLCAGCVAPGVCDSGCRADDYEDRECPTCGTECHCGKDDPQAGQCPGCGGNCQTACA